MNAPVLIIRKHETTIPANTSNGDLSGNFSRRFDMDGMRRQTPQRWMQFLRAHFPDHLTVAVVFDVDEKTARNWWNGKHEPRLSAFLALARSAKRQARAAIMSFMLEAA